jgi:hypothetical protein
MVDMDAKESPEVWDQLTNESSRACEAFKLFMHLPPAERSIAAAWRVWTDNSDAAGARATDGKTLMTMVQRGFPSAELRDEHRAGLPNAFARLEQATEE